MSSTGMECRGQTAAVTIAYKQLQQAINEAAQALTVPHTPLVMDGVIGRKTAYLFNAVLQEYAKKATFVPGDRGYVWTTDPRTGKRDTYASLLAMQPRYATETMLEAKASAPQVPAPSDTTFPPATTIPPTTSTTTPPSTSPTSQLPPKMFWTRRKKFVLAGVAVAGIGIIAYFVFRPKPLHRVY
jgi:hypothetical protein